MVIPRFQRRYHSLILGVFLPFLKLVVAQSFLYCIFSLSHTSLSSSILEGSLFLKTHIIRLGPFRHSTKLSIQRFIALITPDIHLWLKILSWPYSRQTSFFSLWSKCFMFYSHSLKPLFFLSFYSLWSDDLLVTEKLETTKCELSHLIPHKYTKPETVLHIILQFFSKQDRGCISPSKMWPLVAP